MVKQGGAADSFFGNWFCEQIIRGSAALLERAGSDRRPGVREYKVHSTL